MYYEKHRSSRSAPALKSKKYTFLSILIVVIVVFALINIRVEALIKPAVEITASSLFTKTVSDAVNEVMCSSDTGQPVVLSRGEDGTITAIETDTVTVNRIKSDISISALSALENGSCKVSIPVGSLTGIPGLTGRGPRVTLKLIPAGAVSSELYSTLEEAGINQTRHTITCVVSSKMHAMLPGLDIPLEMSTTVLLAESVVVGRIPESYTNVIGDKSDTIGRIFDYAEPGK